MVGTQISGAATPDAAAVYFNPAQLAYAERPELLAGGLLVMADIEYRRERRAIYQREDSLDFALPIDPNAVDASKTGWAKRETSHPVGVAPTLFGVYPFGGGRFGVGLGVYAPFAAQASFDRLGAQRFALQKGSIAALFGTAAVSYRPVRAVSFGAGISYVLGVADLWRVQDFAGLGDVGAGLAAPPVNQANDFGPNAPPGVRELDAMARPIAIRGAIAHAATFNLGVASEPLRGLRLGLGYQHRTRMYFRGPFTLDMDNDFFTQDLEKQGLKYPPRVRGDAEIALTLPSAIRAGASWQVSRRFGLGVNAVYTFWSQLQSIRVTVRSPDLVQPELGLPDRSVVDFPRRFKNTIGADLVLRAAVSRSLSLWLPLGYRSAAAPDSTIDASTPDGDRLVFGFGSGFQLSPRYAVLSDVNFQTIVPRRVVGSDNDLGNGKYWLSILTLGLALRVSFDAPAK